MTGALRRVLLAALVLTAIDLGQRVFVNNDEARFPVLAADILARGDWLRPELHGIVYQRKPLLLVWLIALLSAPFGGVTQLTAVVPSALAAIATALAVYALGRDMFGRDAGRVAALVALTTVGFFVHGRIAMPDMLLTAWMTGSLVFLWPMTRGRRPYAWLGFYGCVAGAFWSKGPAGLLPLAIALGWAAAGWRSGRWRMLALPRGVPLLIALIAPYFLIGLLSSPTGLHKAVVDDQLRWFLMPRGWQLSNIFAPIEHSAGMLFPWVLVLPVVIRQAITFLRGNGAEREAVWLLLLWALVVFVVIGLSQQQRFRYYLPIVPPVALLVGWWAAGAMVHHREPGTVPWRIYAVLLGALALVPILKNKGFGRPLKGVAPMWWEVGLMAVALALFLGALAYGISRNRLQPTFTLAWAAAAVMLVVGYHAQLRQLDIDFNYRGLSAHVQSSPLEVPLLAWDVPYLPLTFYSSRLVIPVTSPRVFETVAASHPARLLVIPESVRSRQERLQGLEVLASARLDSRRVSVVALPGAGGTGPPK